MIKMPSKNYIKIMINGMYHVGYTPPGGSYSTTVGDYMKEVKEIVSNLNKVLPTYEPVTDELLYRIIGVFHFPDKPRKRMIEVIKDEGRFDVEIYLMKKRRNKMKTKDPILVSEIDIKMCGGGKRK